MSSSICPHFTQNAWKKDLCSNCFKSKDEHKQAAVSSSAASKFSAAFTSKAKLAASSLVSKSAAAAAAAAEIADNNKKTDYPNKHKAPAKSIIKKSLSSVSSKTSRSSSKSHKVSFPKQLSEVIGYGGEWSDNDSDDDDDHDFMNLGNDRDDMAATSTDDEETLEMKRITRANTDFNMINGNLLGDPQENIKKSFAALKLGAPQVDKEGKKQTLKINVVPFGATSTAASAECTKQAATATTTVKAKFEATNKVEIEASKSEKVVTKQNVTVVKSTAKKTTTTTASTPITMSSTTKTSTTATATKNLTLSSSAKPVDASNSDSDGKNSPPIERAMEKSLLDEISETLEQKQNESKKLEKVSSSLSTTSSSAGSTSSKIKFEITSLSESIENKPFLDLKKPIARNPPITKDHAKPKINVFHKYSDSESNCSDGENGISAYYDVVETQTSYENLPDGKCVVKEKPTVSMPAEQATDKSIFSSSQYITDMLLSSKTRAASYNLHEGNFMTSKITSDGLIVTKCSSDDALDSTGSSFDGSSDEETSYNMTRSESDSGIGISIGNDYKNINVSDKERLRVEMKLSASTNNSDYEDIQVANQTSALNKANGVSVKAKPAYILEKSRELHGEPDGSADPDGSLESQKEPKVQQQQLPALPKSPPPTKTIDARPSFLHGLQKQHPPILLKKPDLPAKPIVVSPVNSPLKTFVSKRNPTNVEQQVINQLQMVMSKSSENLNASTAAAAAADLAKDDAKLKKGKAPNPPPEQKSSAPPTPERDYNMVVEFEEQLKKDEQAAAGKKATEEKQQSVKAQQDSLISAELKKSNVRAEVKKQDTVADAIAATFASSAASSIYTRKLPTTANATSNSGGTKNTTIAASPAVIREKDKRERATVNPKFRSLNTFVTQRTNAVKNLQLQSASSSSSSFSLKQQSMTPEPTPKNHHKNNLFMSEENLAAATASTVNLAMLTGAGGDKNKSTTPQLQPPQKTKTKFSIKKFLRMGASKTTDNLHKKDGIYSEICTGEESGVTGKPRLVIIHPIDINPTAVEVVKDITKTNDTVMAQTVAVVTAKPPAPPLRAIDGQRAHEINKPARPPPPKSAELRRKQKISLSAAVGTSSASTGNGGEAGGSIKCKSDNVYANLGEIRSSIAPRKPERTASMREREAQLELARKRHVGSHSNENVDTISLCSSNGDNVSASTESQYSTNPNGTTTTSNKSNKSNNSTLSPKIGKSTAAATTVVDGKPPTGSSGSRTSTFERRKSDPKIAIANKLEIFESRTDVAATTNIQNQSSSAATVLAGLNASNEGRPSSLKDSVRKINSTIDSYLKDKRDYENMYEFVKTAASPPPPPARSVVLPRRNNQQNNNQQSNIYSDTLSIASYSRSEYGPVRNYGLNNSLANIPRVISASYCGSEVSEFDIYSPYSYYGSEAGGDVATDINDSVWGVPSAIKNRSKATNRLRMRKGRSVVHKNIEDNYTAVVVANHEALAQVLDQLQQTPIIPPALRPLANAINLRFEDFTILEGAQAFVVGKKAFHAAIWTTAPVTLALSADCNQLSGVGGEFSQLSGGISGVLNPITEFCDIVPSYHLPLMPSTEVTLLQATISVLPRLQLDTLQSIGSILKGKSQVLDKSNFNFRGSIPNLSGLKDSMNANALRNVVSVQNLSTLNEESMEKSVQLEHNSNDTGGAQQSQQGMPAFDDVMTREVAFIMLQLVNGMKNLQVKAIEDMPLSLSNVVLSKDVDNKDAQARLCVLQGNNHDEDEPMGTLCKCAHVALTDMLPATKITPILGDILQQERAESLSKAKAVLEFVLWGPSDVVLSGSVKERELALQRWLDLERATVLHGLVRTRIELTVYDECHLMFLVRSTAKMMNDAAKIVCNYQHTTATAAAAEQHD